MNLYPVDNAVRFLSLIRWITNYPLDSIIFPFIQLGPGLQSRLSIQRQAQKSLSHLDSYAEYWSNKEIHLRQCVSVPLKVEKQTLIERYTYV